MNIVLALVVCLATQPSVCEHIVPAMERDDGAPLTLADCYGAAGQLLAHQWLVEHPAYTLRGISCVIGNAPPSWLRGRVSSPGA